MNTTSRFIVVASIYVVYRGMEIVCLHTRYNNNGCARPTRWLYLSFDYLLMSHRPFGGTLPTEPSRACSTGVTSTGQLIIHGNTIIPSSFLGEAAGMVRTFLAHLEQAATTIIPVAQTEVSLLTAGVL